MGGIINTGISINCDRCGRTVPVTDEKQTKFYREFAGRDQKRADERMFVAIFNLFDKPVDVEFEYLCPKCAESVQNRMAQIDTRLAPKEEEPAVVEAPKAAAEVPTVVVEAPKAAAETKKAGKAKATAAVTIVADETKPGVAFTDTDLFGG